MTDRHSQVRDGKPLGLAVQTVPTSLKNTAPKALEVGTKNGVATLDVIKISQSIRLNHPVIDGDFNRDFRTGLKKWRLILGE